MILFLFHLLALIISHSLVLYQLFRLTSSLPSLSRSLFRSLAFTISIELLVMYIYVHCYHALSIHAHKKKKHTEDEEHTFRSKLTLLTWTMHTKVAMLNRSTAKNTDASRNFIQHCPTYGISHRWTSWLLTERRRYWFARNSWRWQGKCSVFRLAARK